MKNVHLPDPNPWWYLHNINIIRNNQQKKTRKNNVKPTGESVQFQWREAKAIEIKIDILMAKQWNRDHNKQHQATPSNTKQHQVATNNTASNKTYEAVWFC